MTRISLFVPLGAFYTPIMKRKRLVQAFGKSNKMKDVLGDVDLLEEGQRVKLEDQFFDRFLGDIRDIYHNVKNIIGYEQKELFIL